MNMLIMCGATQVALSALRAMVNKKEINKEDKQKSKQKVKKRAWMLRRENK